MWKFSFISPQEIIFLFLADAISNPNRCPSEAIWSFGDFPKITIYGIMVHNKRVNILSICIGNDIQTLNSNNKNKNTEEYQK